MKSALLLPICLLFVGFATVTSITCYGPFDIPRQYVEKTRADDSVDNFRGKFPVKECMTDTHHYCATLYINGPEYTASGAVCAKKCTEVGAQEIEIPQLVNTKVILSCCNTDNCNARMTTLERTKSSGLVRNLGHFEIANRILEYLEEDVVTEDKEGVKEENFAPKPDSDVRKTVDMAVNAEKEENSVEELIKEASKLFGRGGEGEKRLFPIVQKVDQLLSKFRDSVKILPSVELAKVSVDVGKININP